MRAIPDQRDAVLNLASRALGGLRRRGDEVLVRQNTAERLEADLRALNGNIAGEGEISTGLESQLCGRREVLREARIARDAAVAEARTFCANAIDLFKVHLGRVWNPRWEAAGFSTHSLAVPKYQPLGVLIGLRNYLNDHPERAHPAIGVTAAEANRLIAQLEQAVHGVDAARSRRMESSAQRDAAYKRLRKRLTALRCELDLLLEPDDLRWVEFGFSQPGLRRSPEPVEELQQQPSLPGTARLEWKPAPRAENYRVRCEVAETGERVEVAEPELFFDPGVTLTGLPAGVRLRFLISARNRRGESQPRVIETVLDS